MQKRPRFPCSVPVAFLVLFAAGLAVSPLRAQQNPQSSSESGSGASGQSNGSASATAAPAGQSGFTVPASFTLPAGTLVSIRTEQFLSSDKNHVGEAFNADLAQPIVIGGWVVARRGQPVLGRVRVAEQAGHVKGQSKLGLELTTLVLADGRQYSVNTQLLANSAPNGTPERAVATVGTGTALGAAIGAAANGGEGAGIGAAIGAGAGLAGLLLTHGRPTVIPPESLLTFQLQSPITFSTENSAQAFQPVTQGDYAPEEPASLERRAGRPEGAPYPPPPPYYSPYGYPAWGYSYGYPAPFFFGFSYYNFGGFRRGFGRWR